MKWRGRVQLRRLDAAFRKAQRKEAWLKQSRRCKYCGTKIPFNECTTDHVKPVSKGGTDNENIVGACRPCNSSKGSMSAAQFRRELKEPFDPDAPLFLSISRIRYKIAQAQEAALRRIARITR